MVVCKEFLDDDAVDNPLAKFHPKNSADYMAQMSTKTLTKRRDHEGLIRQFSEWVSTRGYEPNNTSVHPRDLVLLGADGHEWLVEAKIVYKGNMMNAVRAALAQLLTYRHFLYRNKGPRLVALFNEPVDDAFVSLLESLQIESVWLDGSSWKGSDGAVLASLV